jgi:predicted secreted hydrolase
MAHAALTDLATGKTYFSQRLGGGAIGISNVASDSLDASSGDWTVDSIGGRLVLRFSLQRDSTTTPISIRILTGDLPKPWLQGKQGFSKKATCKSCASMYYSMPRISLDATVNEASTAPRRLHGLAWMDHEFMSNSLADDQVGWDWLGLMLKDGRSLMLFHLRSKDDTRAFASGGVLRGVDKKVLEEKDFSLIPIRYWKSKSSGAQYPTSWHLRIPSEAIDIILTARTNYCEVGFDSATSTDRGASLNYWEGPVASSDESAVGYLEMTGYAGRIKGL